MSRWPTSPRTMVCGLLAAAALLGSAGAAAAAPGWLPAQPVSAAGAAGARIALGEAGDAVAVWQRAAGGDTLVEAAAHPASGGGWAAPATLAAPGQEARGPAVAVDAAGNAVAVFERYDGSHWRIAAAMRPAASGAWSPPVDVSAAGQDARDAHVALDGAGGVLAAWERRNGLSWVVEAAVRPAAGDWAIPVQLSQAGADAGNLQVAMAPGGAAVIAWERAGLQTAVQAAVRPGATGPPAAGETVSATGTSALSPQVAMDAAGNAALAWQGFDGLRGQVVVAARPAGAAAWGPPVAVSPAGEDARDARIGLDAAGGAVALWSRVDGGAWSVRAAARPAAGAPWSAPTTVSPVAGSSVQPGGRLAVDAAGNAVATFVWRPPGASASALLGARRPAAGAWMPAVTVAPEADPAAPPDLAGDRAGDAAAVWSLAGAVQAVAEDAAPPVLRELTLPAAATAGELASFAATAFDAWAGMPGGPLWSFGDGVSVAGPAVGHVYDAPGVYPVTLVGIDALGNVARVSRDLAVGPPAAPRAAPAQAAPRPVAPGLRRLAALPARLRPLVPAGGCRAPLPVGLPPAGRCRGGEGIEIRFVLSAPGAIALAVRPAGGGRPLVSARVAGRAGLNSLRLTGWARGRPLPSGVYQVTLRPGLPPARGVASSVGVVVSR